jgi:ORF6N domain-containing protein
MKETTSNELLEPPIFAIRGHRVVLDADLARLYGADTKRFNEAFKRNRHRFPADFAFELTTAEFNVLRSQRAPDSGKVTDLSNENSMWSQFATTSSRRRRVTYRPWAFTEHGALMAANILRSERAVQMSVFVVRAFIRLREQVAANTAVVARLTEIDKTLLRHDRELLDLYLKLEPLLQPPADPPKRRIGFHRED